MIDSRFGLKYSFPHSLVHIVDNSMYTGPLGVTETYDPSLLATIVVTGMPMGVDNRIVTVTRSDVLNKAFGAETLTTRDIEKYGQSVEYPSSLIAQNVPVKLLRITPDDAAYGVVVIYLDWKIVGTDSDRGEKRLEVRLIQSALTDLESAGINLSAYKNTDRLAKATFSRLKNDDPENRGEVSDKNWHRLVLMSYISAGRGSAYNDFSVYIDRPTYAQKKKFANAVYNFGTLDDRYSSALEIEKFTASLINDATKLSAYGVTTNMATVNVQMKQRLDGSSIMIPYVNEDTVRFIYNKWKTIFKSNIENGTTEYKSRQASYDHIYNTLDVNKFDIIFGKYLYDYNGVEIDLDIPYYTMDMINSNIPQQPRSNIVVERYTGAISGRRQKDILDDSDELIPDKTTSNHVLNAIFEEKIYPYWNDLYGRNQKAYGDDTKNLWDAIGTIGSARNTAYKATDSIVPELTEDTIDPSVDTENNATVHGVKFSVQDNANDVDQNYQKDVNAIKNNIEVTPGMMYLVNASTTKPSISIITSIQQFTGATMSVNIPQLYHVYKSTDGTIKLDRSKTTSIKKVFDYTKANVKNGEIPTTELLDLLNTQIGAASGYVGDSTTAGENGEPTTYGTVVAVTYVDSDSNLRKFKLYRIKGYDKDAPSGDRISEVLEYPKNYYAVLDYESYYNKTTIHDIIVLRSKLKDAMASTATNKEELYPSAWHKYGVIVINDLESALNLEPFEFEQYTQDPRGALGISVKSNNLINIIAYFNKDENDEDVPVLYDVTTWNQSRVGSVPSRISVTTNMESESYDYIYFGQLDEEALAKLDDGEVELIDLIETNASIDSRIPRYQITSMSNSTFKIVDTKVAIPGNYYILDYGVSPEAENGGLPVIGGSSGFFDNDDISDIEFKIRYSDLLVQAFRGEIDSRILSPARVPAKFLFDGGFNTVLGIKSLPFTSPTLEDYIYASSIFTQDEKEEFATNSKLISAGLKFTDIDVKQAMYDLMIQRCYMGIPEDKRPIGPGSGLSLHLDSGFCDIDTIKKMNESFRSRFINPNASWDIGGYTSALNGMTYTYTKRLVDHMFEHMQKHTINKPYVNTYTSISPEEYTSFFPDIDTTDWDLEELLYTSGGNSWVMDESRSLKRKSQRTLYREETGTSDLLQENNMRTLSRLIYLLQNRIDRWLLEYVDDGILSSMTETVNNIFSGWVGTLVQALDIQFEQDINTDGGEIVVCYVNVTFRGLLLRVPIIVNVNRRES